MTKTLRRKTRRLPTSLTKQDCNGHLMEEIEKLLHTSFPGQSVDAVVVQPCSMMRFAADVARSAGKITPDEWQSFTKALRLFEAGGADVLVQINAVVRAAMNGRKRGLVKACGTSPAIRAAATRKGGQ